MKTTLIYDTEVFKDYFLVSFLNTVSGKITHFDMYEGHPLDVQSLRQIVSRYRLIGFNSRNFDMPLLTLAMDGAKCERIKQVSDKIIKNNLKWWTLGIDVPNSDHIDLIEVAPGVHVSLKLYGGRMHCRRLQDLPFDEAASIRPEDRQLVQAYCTNDLETTHALYLQLQPQLALREHLGDLYGIDMRSKSDAQVAEAIVKTGVEARGRQLPRREHDALAGHTFRYELPDFVRFATPELQEIARLVSTVEFRVIGNGTVRMPTELAKLRVKVGQGTYKMGIGGLHSSEQSTAWISDEQHVLVDRDVASYYPAIILNCGLAPPSMGKDFTSVYNQIVQRRLAAKRAGDKVTADSLKISVNGTFGKLGSPYSCLYAPELLIQVTMTGQLSLLMLIETLESEGIQVVSANTDGVTIRCPRQLVPMMDLIVWDWEYQTGFQTEAVEYRALYSRDVNNYLAIKPDGTYKAKGTFVPAGLQKNPANEILNDAVLAYLRDGRPIEQTIRSCTDVRKFVAVRTVTGGAIDQAGNYLGRVVRWYHASGVEGAIRYKTNGNMVPLTDSGRPLMDLPEQLPSDIDYEWYIGQAIETLGDLGVKVTADA